MLKKTVRQLWPDSLKSKERDSRCGRIVALCEDEGLAAQIYSSREAIES